MKRATSSATKTDRDAAVVVKSEDGEVCFHLRPIQSGLLVQRDRRRPDGHARLVQCVVFSSIDGFARWCECDSVRFEYPIISSAVKREGGALLEDHRTASGEPNRREEH